MNWCLNGFCHTRVDTVHCRCEEKISLKVAATLWARFKTIRQVGINKQGARELTTLLTTRQNKSLQEDDVRVLATTDKKAQDGSIEKDAISGYFSVLQ